MVTKPLPDVFDLIKERDKSSVETARTASEERIAMQKSKDLVPCVLGPVGGPYTPCLFSADANMFMPKFKDSGE